ncbi:hypothetical protein LTR56_011216 [Elasticomyces elasticus]|nr:hypothetical protein LTR56_011216 [Elasticomyces elasticus]KAK3650420.1 hypothetical protein LTR22_012510 [Elasticomyces elasticus]KAK4921847.1 hypothetical protein LTR49_010786 [Elasticomyces elasticus]KAK5751427.1 hypothetical protein LTS12_018515 [Elasticomyces elasticus]
MSQWNQRPLDGGSRCASPFLGYAPSVDINEPYYARGRRRYSWPLEPRGPPIKGMFLWDQWRFDSRIRRRMAALVTLLADFSVRRSNHRRANLKMMSYHRVIFDQVMEISKLQRSNTPSDSADLVELHRLHQGTKDHAKKHLDSIPKLQKEQDELQFQIRMKAAGVLDMLKAVQEIVPAANWYEYYIPVSREASPAPPAEEIPPLLTMYNTCRGEMLLCRENLDEHVYTYTDETTEREISYDRGLPLIISDELFNETYETRRTNLTTALKAAEKDAAEAAAQCCAAGIDTDFHTLQLSTDVDRAPDAAPLHTRLENLPPEETKKRTSRKKTRSEKHEDLQIWIDQLLATNR